LVFVDDCEIYNNKFYDNTGGNGENLGAIWIFTMSNTDIHNNEIYNNRNGILMKNTNNVTSSIRYNFIINGSHFGMKMAEQGVSSVGGIEFSHNLIVDFDQGGFLFGDVYDIPDAAIHNNTIVRCLFGYVRTATGIRTHSVYDNIFYQTSSAYMRESSNNYPTYIDYNLYFNSGTDTWMDGYSASFNSLSAWQTEVGGEANSIVSDPVFVNAAGTTISDFALDSESPGLGAGRYGGDIGANITQVGVQQ
jgi:hypothetical protein